MVVLSVLERRVDALTILTVSLLSFNTPEVSATVTTTITGLRDVSVSYVMLIEKITITSHNYTIQREE